jgi:hypothetical protein
MRGLACPNVSAAAEPPMIDCPRAKSWMTPCVARDGQFAAADDSVCVGCGEHPADLLRDLVRRHVERPAT